MRTSYSRFALVCIFLIVVPPAEARWFYTGDCKLDADVVLDGDVSSSFDLCLHGRGGGQLSFVSGHSKENFATGFARGGLGVHALKYLSLYAEGHLVRRTPVGENTIDDTVADSELLLARIGNPELHGFSFASGKFRAPFGVGIEHGSESYRYFTDEFHWRTYEFGHWVSWDDKKNFFLDASYVSETVVGKRVVQIDGSTRASDWGGSLRAGYDFSALEGSRIVGSIYGEHSGERRSGVGFIAINDRGDTNWIEFVRTRTTPDGKKAPFRQIVKFGYLSAERSGSRWSVAVEEDRKFQRIGDFTHFLSVRGYGDFSLGFLYRRDIVGAYSRWHVTSGIEVSL